jgi:hypothetical protein
MGSVLASVHPLIDAPGFLAGGGEMGAQMRAFDWERTPLGPPVRWPLSLQVVVRIVLASHEPLAVWWGGGTTLLYNDACRHMLGAERAPALAGAVPESWIDGSSGLRLALHPVPGEHGQLGGVLCTFAGATAPGA